MPLCMPLTHNFDQRSPHKLSVDLTVSTVAIIAAQLFEARGDPAVHLADPVDVVCEAPFATVRRTLPAA